MVSPFNLLGSTLATKPVCAFKCYKRNTRTKSFHYYDKPPTPPYFYFLFLAMLTNGSVFLPPIWIACIEFYQHNEFGGLSWLNWNVTSKLNVAKLEFKILDKGRLPLSSSNFLIPPSPKDRKISWPNDQSFMKKIHQYPLQPQLGSFPFHWFDFTYLMIYIYVAI